MNQENDEALHWLWSTKLQIVRFVDSFNENIVLSRNLVSRENKEISDSERKVYSRSSAEAHFLVIAANNLKKAMNKLGNLSGHDKEIMENIEILRNNLEHWDENKIQFENIENKKILSAKTYAEKFPNQTPWSFALDSRGLVIGGILVVGDLLMKLDALEQKFLNGKKQK